MVRIKVEDAKGFSEERSVFLLLDAEVFHRELAQASSDNLIVVTVELPGGEEFRGYAVSGNTTFANGIMLTELEVRGPIDGE